MGQLWLTSFGVETLLRSSWASPVWMMVKVVLGSNLHCLAEAEILGGSMSPWRLGDEGLKSRIGFLEVFKARLDRAWNNLV